MQEKLKYIAIFFTIGLSLSACQKSTESGVIESTIAKITAFGFTPVDSLPGLGAAYFIVEELNDTGLIRMRKNDSVRYGTPLTRIIPKITYLAKPASVVVYLKDSMISLTGHDTLDFSIQPIKIWVIAQNKNYRKWYNLDVHVHTVNPDYFNWETLCEQITTQTVGRQQLVVVADKAYYFINDGFRPRLLVMDLTTPDAKWEEQTIAGLPNDVNVRQIYADDTRGFFYANGSYMYTSADGMNWNQSDLGIDVIASYMFFNDSIWLAGYKDGQYALYSWQGQLTDHSDLLSGTSLPQSLPVEDFATVRFQSTSLHHHAMIAGGYNQEGKMVNGRWSLEYNEIYKQYRLVDLSVSQPNTPAFAEAALVNYNNRLMMIGGVWEDQTLIDSAYVSTDEGMNWVALTDTANHNLPSEFGARKRVCAVADDEYLYLVGGEDLHTIYSDTYRGRLNSIGWDPIGD